MCERDTSSTLTLQNRSFTSLTLSFKLASSELLITVYFSPTTVRNESGIEVIIKLLSSATIELLLEMSYF